MIKKDWKKVQEGPAEVYGQGDLNPHNLLAHRCQELQPAFKEVRKRLSWWRRAGAPEQVISYIVNGVEPQWTSPMLQLIPQPRRIADEKLALQILEDYQQVGAVQEVSPYSQSIGSHVLSSSKKRMMAKKIFG
jgi:hypothetical protein